MNTPTIHNQTNPFLKIGDVIYLHSRQGKYRVVSINNAGFSVVPEHGKADAKSIDCLWDDIKRWSSRSS